MADRRSPPNPARLLRLTGEQLQIFALIIIASRKANRQDVTE
jgi:hypothetical protein